MCCISVGAVYALFYTGLQSEPFFSCAALGPAISLCWCWCMPEIPLAAVIHEVQCLEALTQMKKPWHEENRKFRDVFALCIGSASSWVQQGCDPECGLCWAVGAAFLGQRQCL